MPFSYLCCVIVLLETGQIKLITLLLMNPTCSYFKPSSFSRGLCIQTLSSRVKQRRSRLKCVSSALVFVPFEGLCSSEGRIPAATGDVTHFVSPSDIFSRSERECHQSDFGGCPCVLFLRWQRVTVIRGALYWCVRVCGAHVPSRRGPAHVWWVGLGGEHGLIKHVDEKNSMPFVSEKQRLLWIHYFMVACRGVICSRLRGSRLWGLIKPNSCWFVVVVVVGEEGKGVAKRTERKDVLRSAKNWGRFVCFLGPAALIGCGECIKLVALIEPGNDSRWNTVRKQEAAPVRTDWVLLSMASCWRWNNRKFGASKS